MGTVIASTATGPREVRRNLFTNPRFVSPFDGWAFVQATASTPVAGFVDLTVGSTPPTSNFVTPVTTHAAIPLEPYSARYMVRNMGTTAFTLRLSIYTGAEYLHGPSLVFEPGVIGSVERNLITPANAEYMQPRLHAVSIDAGAVVRVYQPLAELSPVLGSYFDGTTPPSDGRTFSWAGEPNASPSIESIIAPVVEVHPEVVDGWEVAREVRNIVHTILNRTEPDVTLRQPGMRSGRFTMVFADEPAALTAYAGLSVPQTLIISDEDVPAVDMQFVVADAGGGTDEMTMRLDDDTRSVWLVEVPFTEVGT